jgi:RNA polymerase sigma factor (sigma-70 family)
VWLSQAQQELVTDHLYVARLTAKRKGSASDPDRSLSAAYYGLCRAAGKWDPEGGRSFRNYAIWACQKAILVDWLHGRRRNDGSYIDDGPVAAETNSFDLDRVNLREHPAMQLIRAEQRLRLSLALKILRPRAIEIIELALTGANGTAIAKMLGMTRQTVSISIIRSTAKLKRFLADETT